jgi:hypothetical protein
MAQLPARKAGRRKATPPLLRALALLVALLLVGSSLGQIAHFLLVPHTLCEHGELVEVHGAAADAEADSHAKAHGTAKSQPGHHDSQPSGTGSAEAHDHCQQLARAQRDLALPVAEASAPVALPGAPLRTSFFDDSQRFAPLAALSLAPKTSPPVAAFG